MKQPDSSFFLAINHRRQPGSQIWYNKAPLGKNEIGKFLSKAVKAAKLPGNITNHSVRKTCISRLMAADIPENYVAQLSGHKNLKSLDSYKSASSAPQSR
jgi:integrase